MQLCTRKRRKKKGNNAHLGISIFIPRYRDTSNPVIRFLNLLTCLSFSSLMNQINKYNLMINIRHCIVCKRYAKRTLIIINSSRLILFFLFESSIELKFITKGLSLEINRNPSPPRNSSTRRIVVITDLNVLLAYHS